MSNKSPTWIICAALFVPMLIFAALPNVFFGYESADTESVATLTQQAADLGWTYLSLEEFEAGYIDSLATSLSAEYEQNGATVAQIEVHSSFTEDDLIWLIAINSAAHQQDLKKMSTAEIHMLSMSSLSYSAVLSGENVLTITVNRLDPDALMDKLGLGDEAKTWAGVFHEVLTESGALEQYAAQLGATHPNYGGDTSYTGGIEHGTGHSTEIDISHFVSLSTKNNLDLAAYAIQAWENGWGYVYGTFGGILTDSLFAYKLEQYPNGVGNYADFIRENWLGGRTADCVGLIKGYGWLDTSDLTIRYGTNGMPDYSANQMYYSAAELGTEYGTMDTMPDIPGLAVWKPGHIGVYIGGGYVIEAMGTKYGVVKTELAGRGWSGWCKIPYIDYLEE